MTDITSKMQLILEATKLGLENISTNYVAIALIVIAFLIIRFVRRSYRRVRYFAYLAIVSGYGSVLFDGLKAIVLNSGLKADNIIAAITQLFQSIG